MSDKLPDHADLEKYCYDLPKTLIDRLPDCIASRRARELQKTVYEYTKEARESANRPPSLAVGDDGRLRWGGD